MRAACVSHDQSNHFVLAQCILLTRSELLTEDHTVRSLRGLHCIAGPGSRT